MNNKKITRGYVNSLREWVNEKSDAHNNRSNILLPSASILVLTSIVWGFLYMYNSTNNNKEDNKENNKLKNNKKRKVRTKKKNKKKIKESSDIDSISLEEDESIEYTSNDISREDDISSEDDINTDDMSVSDIDSENISLSE